MNYSVFYRFCAKSSFTSLWILVLSFVLIGGTNKIYAQTPTGEKTANIDRNRLEVIEELSESLANDLLQLSVATRDRDMTLTAAYFPLQLNTKPFPSRPSATQNQVKWVGIHGWETADKSNSLLPKINANSSITDIGEINGKDFLNGWTEFLNHFSEIEDARFKVKEANFDDKSKAVLGAEQPTAEVGANGRARIAFYVIGRDGNGNREWARGSFWANVRADKNKHWQFYSFEIVSFDSMVADTDLFSEVGVPAGVGAVTAAFGSAENSGFVWHGAAAGDFNNDGWIDLFVVGANRNYLYLNDKNGSFRDVSDEAGVKITASGSAPLIFDYDNDGDGDIFISAVGQQMLFENQFKQTGKLEFRDISLT